MENSKSPTLGFYCCVALTLLVAYVADYGIARWQDVLMYDVIVRRGNDGIWRSGTGITSCAGEEFENWQRHLSPPAESVFFPLCEIETVIWNKMRYPE
jgi:hypothetical protein